MNKKLLVVDDESSVTKLITRVFAGSEYAVMIAADGPEALSLLRQQRPDVMLLDVHLPQLDGLEVLRQTLEIYPDLPIIVVTGDATDPVAQRMMAAGARDYVTKPIDFNYLETTVLAHST